MGKQGCNDDGSLNQDSFTEPLPAIGVYIAGASLLCLFAMALDAFFWLRRRKPWFPCRFFSLNATTLTVLTVATKLAGDINTSMPSRSDQLSKLSSTVLICTAMGNFMPSVGTMNGSGILSNIIALGILVITVIVNVSIQMGTGAIYVFLPEHAIIMFFMLVLLALLGFSALIVPTTRQILNSEYELKFRELAKPEKWGFDFEKLKMEVVKFSMMTYTSSPRHVLERSATCTAAGALCLLSALVLVEAVIRSFLVRGRAMRFCTGNSDYGWSTWAVFVSHVLVVVVGSLAPVFRWLNAINFRNGNWSCRKELKVEKYWVQRLEEWKKSPFLYHINSRRGRMIVHHLKNQILDVVIVAQVVVVWVSKFIRLTSILLVILLNKFLILFRSLFKRLPKMLGFGLSLLGSSDHVVDIEKDRRLGSDKENQPHPLSYFVLHLEGEQDLVELISTSGCKETEKWITRGKKNIPSHLIKLLEKSNASCGFKGVLEFDSNEVPPVFGAGSEIPPSCWALPVVTLTSIAVSIFHSDEERIKLLLKGVREGLKFVKFIDRNLSYEGMINMRKAAEIVWLGIDVYNCWLDVNLHNLGSNGGTFEIIRELADIGQKHVLESKERINMDPLLQWPIDVVAGYSLYRLCTTILLDCDKHQTTERLFNWLEQTISDLLGACFTNIPRAIFVECSCAFVEAREGRVRNAAYFLGEAENFLNILGRAALDDLNLDESGCLDIWRYGKQFRNPQSLSCASSDNNMSTLAPATLSNTPA